MGCVIFSHPVRYVKSDVIFIKKRSDFNVRTTLKKIISLYRKRHFYDGGAIKLCSTLPQKKTCNVWVIIIYQMMIAWVIFDFQFLIYLHINIAVTDATNLFRKLIRICYQPSVIRGFFFWRSPNTICKIV